MFEKEANEYAKEVTKKYVFMEHGRASALGFQKGAEFGYNKDYANSITKAKEIIKSLISTLELIDGEQIYELGEVKEAERFLNGEVEK